MCEERQDMWYGNGNHGYCCSIVNLIWLSNSEFFWLEVLLIRSNA